MLPLIQQPWQETWTEHQSVAYTCHISHGEPGNTPSKRFRHCRTHNRRSVVLSEKPANLMSNVMHGKSSSVMTCKRVASARNQCNDMAGHLCKLFVIQDMKINCSLKSNKLSSNQAQPTNLQTSCEVKSARISFNAT